MIASKKDLLYYLESDRIALGRSGEKTLKSFIRELFAPDLVHRFQILLRKTEYYYNTRKESLLSKILLLFYRYRLHRLSVKLHFSVPLNAAGPGLSLAHIGSVIINNGAKLGANCRIHAGVNIGTQAGYGDKAPRIGNNVYIGPGAKIYGPICIADDCVIGANAVVGKSFLNKGMLIAGVPAREIKPVDSRDFNIHATKIIDLNISPALYAGKTAVELKESLKIYGY